MNDKVELGVSAKHIINGVEGIATCKSVSLNGTVQYAIMPDGTLPDGKPYDQMWYDEGMLSRTETNACAVVEASKTDIVLGNTVEHLSGFVGVALERVEYINGCVFIGIMPKTEDPNKLPEMQYVPCQYLHVHMEKEIVETASDDKGGPATKAPTM